MSWIGWDVLSDAAIVASMLTGGILLALWVAGVFDDPRQSL